MRHAKNERLSRINLTADMIERQEWSFLSCVKKSLTALYEKHIEINNKNLFGVWGVLVHLILLWGVLDVNFHSPIIRGHSNIRAPVNPPAKRLVLLVADGLRFRTFNEEPPSYLKHVMDYKGAWGVSHTRLPTESRPGIVAICAGLYEDPSALFRGWKEYPVEFDSIFNQSRYTWAWGSPDIIPIFTKGGKPNIIGESYPHEWENFDITQGEIWRLDAWVFDKYKKWLEEDAKKVKDKDGVILFLHLLGCDTTGHTAKPYSEDYINNMRYIDEKIEELVQMTENFFQDNGTAYVFTADHGMTNWGSHGSGSTDETETPLVVWGAGANIMDVRQDVEQVDITPLIASLIGIPIPVNNEGVLPWQYIDTEFREYGSEALFVNLKQLTHQVRGTRELSCGDNTDGTFRNEMKLNNQVSKIDQYFRLGYVDRGIRETVEALKFTKSSLLYFRQYQRSRFLVCLSVMWLGWIVVLFLKMGNANRQSVQVSLLMLIDVGFLIALLTTFVKYHVSECLNWRLPCYIYLAVFSVWLASRTAVFYTPLLVFRWDKRSKLEVAGTIFLLITMYTGLTFRAALSIGMLSTAFIEITLYKGAHNLLFVTGVCLSVFPLLPVVEPQPRVYIVLLSMGAMAIAALFRLRRRHLKIMEVIRIAVTGLVYVGIIDGRGWVSWAILLSTPISIFTYSNRVEERMQGIILGLFCPLALLSASYEPLFYMTLALHLLCWIQMDSFSLRSSNKDALTTAKLLKAAFFMLYTLLCFFGTGNMASISSFDPSWTRHFVTVFSPFLMFSLILFKISIPMLLVGCISHILRSPVIFLVTLLLGDCLTLPLMYRVTPYGSWLDIGSAISRFTIAIALPCLLLLLHYLSYPVMLFNIKKMQFQSNLEKKHIV